VFIFWNELNWLHENIQQQRMMLLAASEQS